MSSLSFQNLLNGVRGALRCAAASGERIGDLRQAGAHGIAGGAIAEQEQGFTGQAPARVRRSG
jgi:hypothetical protein